MSEDIKLEEVNEEESSPEEESKDTQDPIEDTPEEWTSLTGKAQDRFKKVISQKNEEAQKRQEETQKRLQAEEELARLREERMNTGRTETKSGEVSAEEQAALNRLKELKAFVTPADLEKERSKIRAELRAERDREVLNNAHEKLETSFDGSNEYPAYDRQAVEEFMRNRGIYDPETAYEKMHKEEILDIEVKKRSKSKKEPFTERTKSRIATGQPWTPETLSDRLKQSDGRQFYLKNKDKIIKLQEKWTREG